MDEVVSQRDLRCFCSTQPLIAKWSVDKNGSAFLHIKVHKQRRLYSEIVVTEGNDVHVRCKVCLRWHRIRVRAVVRSQEAKLPDAIPTAGAA